MRGGAQRQDRDHYLESFEKDTLEGHHKGNSITMVVGGESLELSDGLTIDRIFVVLCFQSAGAKYRLTQPLHTKDEQDPAHHESQGTERYVDECGPERCYERSERSERYERSLERRAPSASVADRQHDRESFHHLHGAGKKHRTDEDDDAR